MAKHPEAFQHVGLLVNESAGTTSLPFNQLSEEFGPFLSRGNRCNGIDKRRHQLFFITIDFVDRSPSYSYFSSIITFTFLGFGECGIVICELLALRLPMLSIVQLQAYSVVCPLSLA